LQTGQDTAYGLDRQCQVTADVGARHGEVDLGAAEALLATVRRLVEQKRGHPLLGALATEHQQHVLVAQGLAAHAAHQAAHHRARARTQPAQALVGQGAHR
jgi:hypothetical protein